MTAPSHSPSHGHLAGRTRSWAMAPDLIVGRLAGAGLLAWMGWIHLHLWSSGFKHLPSIGNLFLLNFIGGVLLSLLVLITRPRFVWLVSTGGFLMAVGTLGSLAISVNTGLFGFKDSYNAPFVHLSIWVECAAVVVLAATAIRAFFLRGA
jgi:hypothetical protein